MRVDNTLPLTAANGSLNTVTPKPGSDNFSQVLEAAKEATTDKDIKEASQQLEAVFLLQLFTQMRKTVPKSSLSGGQEMATGIFQNMFDQEVSIQSSLNGGTGLAEIIYQQLSGPPYQPSQTNKPIDTANSTNPGSPKSDQELVTK